MNSVNSRETFQKLPVENKLDILFDHIVSLSKWKMWATAYATLAGFVGGLTGVYAYMSTYGPMCK